MSNRVNNFNTGEESTRILTPNDATIIKLTTYLLKAERPIELLSSLELLFYTFLESETADDQNLRTSTQHHFILLRDFLQDSIDLTPKTV